MPIHSISKDTMEELKKQINEKKELFKFTKDRTPENMWIDDLRDLLKFFK